MRIRTLHDVANISAISTALNKELYQASISKWRQLWASGDSSGLSFHLFVFDGWR
jgi:hypothetical protein